MAKEDKVELEGEVPGSPPERDVPGRARTTATGVLGHVAGKLRRFRIRILPGDRVRVEALGPTTSTAPGSSTAIAEVDDESG